MKDVPVVKMPMPLADLCHPERWPLRGRNDPPPGLMGEAVPTPSADTPEEVAEDVDLEGPGEADDQGPE